MTLGSFKMRFALRNLCTEPTTPRPNKKAQKYKEIGLTGSKICPAPGSVAERPIQQPTELAIHKQPTTTTAAAAATGREMQFATSVTSWGESAYSS